MIYLYSKSCSNIELIKSMGFLFLYIEDVFEYLSKLDPFLWTNIESDKPTYGYSSSSIAESGNERYEKSPYSYIFKVHNQLE